MNNSMISHSFSPVVAEKLGVARAVILQHFIHLQDYSTDGWVVKSQRALAKTYPYIKLTTLVRHLDSLVTANMVLTKPIKGTKADKRKRKAYYVTSFGRSLYNEKPFQNQPDPNVLSRPGNKLQNGASLKNQLQNGASSGANQLQNGAIHLYSYYNTLNYKRFAPIGSLRYHLNAEQDPKSPPVAAHPPAISLSMEVENVLRSFDNYDEARQAWEKWHHHKCDMSHRWEKAKGSHQEAVKRLRRLSAGKAADATKIVAYSVSGTYGTLHAENKKTTSPRPGGKGRLNDYRNNRPELDERQQRF